MKRSCLSVLSLLFVTAAATLGCSTTPAGALAQPPAFEPKGQSKCAITKSQARPLIVEWPSADRGELEDRARRGLVAVRYVGCEMQIVPACRVPGSYAYSALSRKRDRVLMKDADDLYANIPVGAAKLEGKLAKLGELSVNMTIVGRYNADRDHVAEEELAGDCADATHVITALTAGAFEFLAGAEAEVGAGVDVGGAGVGARSRATRETLSQDGDEKACEQATDEDKKPPTGCRALLRIEVAPIARTTRARAVPARTPEAPAPEIEAPPPAAPPPAAAPPAAKADKDGDGIANNVDLCPFDPEDKDGFEDDDGCPDPDNDRDGVSDAEDACPSQAGPRSSRGCPDPGTRR
jgi:hypothetical protein